ncbi:bucky ball-like [Siniperca chuatsi]|uniref:bucky ball-like n=1 Tax=Siniperca chuatsi TaxID=119488 RepID=UPI001CE142EA|nr:bucky ball-like [Siniperca chuatsi]XP_044031783.1 bucky ball-like [Siniperca chuatsi]
MDDGSKQPHTFGSGQRTHHPRPFFYVQPPSQPYYLYQHWQMNNPYSHYGLPGGFNFGRPCMHPYQYMHYPGYIFPHAPIYPMDHRRMFEPRFHVPAWNDMPRQQYHPQPYGRRETACSEAQTDPSDAITKLIECLDKIRGSDLQGVEGELDSGVASQSSGMFSPREAKTREEQGHILPSAPDVSHLESSAVTFSDSTTAVYDGESSRRSLDALSSQGCWSGGLEEELPLDSSSVHEECPELEQPAADEHFLRFEKAEVTDIQSDTSVTDSSVPKCVAEELLKQRVDPILPSTPSVPSSSFTSSQPALKDAKSGNKVSKTEHQKADPSYQILKLPFENVLTPGDAEAGRLSSPAAAPYYYNYLSMHTTHERMSVLSPSLDELSSRDEMFSTDLDDADLFPKHVYPGRRLAEVVSGSPQAAEEVEVWLTGSKRLMCACCGKSLAKGASRSKVHSSKMYRDEAGDSEEESRYGRGCEQPARVVVRKHSAPRKPHSAPLRHAAKPWYKRGQYKDSSDPVNQEEGHEVCKQEPADGEVGEMTGIELQCRTCQDGHCREALTTSDQGRWGDGDVIPRRRQATPLQRQEMSTQRKVMYHRPRDEDNDDDEPPPLPWERGSTMRGEPRC